MDMDENDDKEACIKLNQMDDFYFCGDYANRPLECSSHDFPFQVCPIGLSKLKINSNDSNAIQKRLKRAWSLINEHFPIDRIKLYL